MNLNVKEQNNSQKRKNGSIFKSLSKRITDAFKLPNNEKAWDNFPEETKKEMLESLKMKDSVNLYRIDLNKIIELEPSIKGGENLIFKEGVKKEDSIGEYIEINGHKCRAYEPGISGFAYKNIQTRYNQFRPLEIGFYEKGTPKNYVIIDLSLKPEQINIPNGEKLGGPFFLKNDESSIGKDSPLYNVSRNDISQYPSKENNNTLTIKGTTFQQFKPGITGFVYHSFDSEIEPYRKNLFLAEYKNGEMIGEGVIMSREGVVYKIVGKEITDHKIPHNTSDK